MPMKIVATPGKVDLIMINLLEVLFPYIALFYVMDCFAHVKKFHIAFFSHFGGKFKVKKPGFRFISFSPIAQFYLVSNFPFFSGKEGIYVWNKEDFDELDLYEENKFDFLLFDEINKIECVDEDIIINNNKKIVLNSSYLARHLAEKIEKLKHRSPRLRLKDSSSVFKDPKDLDEIINCHTFYLLRLLGAVLFSYLFVLLPFFIYLGIAVNLGFILSAIALFYILITGLSLYVHKIIYKSPKKCIILFFTLLFSPVSSIHAIQIITKPLAVNYEWIAFSAYLLRPENFKPLLINELKRIHFSKEKCKNSDLMSFLLLKEKQYIPFLQNAGLAHSEIFIFPSRKDPTAQRFCPFCEAEFQKAVDACTECSVGLEEYDAAEPAALARQ